MDLYTGMDYFSDTLGIPEATFKVAMSFYSGEYPLIYRESWATNSCSGVAVGISQSNWSNNFFKSGSLNFDGKSIVRFSNTGDPNNSKLFLEDSTIFLSFERLREGNEILLSSIDGSEDLYSGYCLGVNEANKLYIKYWNSVEGNFTLTSKLYLSNKNLISINKDGSSLTLGRFNNNTLLFDNETFSIYKNNFVDSNDLVLGGYYSESQPLFLDKNRAPWAFDNAKNFSGIIDKFYYIYNMPSAYKDLIVSGIFTVPSGAAGYTEINCYETGFFQETGSFVLTKTGVFASGYVSGETVITGYQPILSGYTYYGLLGYENILVNQYTDQCLVTHDIYEKRPISGNITDYITVQLPIYATIYRTGVVEIDLSGLVFKVETIPVTQTICDDIFIVTGDTQFKYDTGYLAGLSYNKVYFPYNNNSFIWQLGLEVYKKPYTLETFKYNKDAIYGELDGNFWIEEQEYSDSKYFEFFSNGKNLFESGYTSIQNEYEEIIVPNKDYYLSGEIFYPGSTIINNPKKLFYDYQESPFSNLQVNQYTYIFTPELRNRIFTGKNFDRAFFYRNGVKLRDITTYSPQYEVLTWPASGEQTNPIDIWEPGTVVEKIYPHWNRIAYGNDMFVCIPNTFGFNSIAVSTNAIDWSGINLYPNSQSLPQYRALNFVNDKFVLLRGTTTQYSFNGINWYSGILPSSPAIPSNGNIEWSQIAYGQNKYIVYARAYNTPYGLISTDGINWSYISNRPNSAKYINKLIYLGDDLNGVFVGICGQDVSSLRESVVIRSFDGNFWTSNSFMPIDAEWRDMAYGNSRLIAIGKNNNAGFAAISFNSGASWSSLSSLNGLWNSITYGDGVFMALGKESGAYSYDGTVWNRYKLTDINPGRPQIPSSFEEYSFTAFGKGRFVSLDRYHSESSPTQYFRTGACFDLYQSISIFSNINNIPTLFSYKDYGSMDKLPIGETISEEKSNNLCSHAYLNGLRQNLGEDYLEISNFDLLSGYLETPIEKNIIYNISQGFLELS